METFRTTYSTAVHWLHNQIILCNEIVAIDPSVFDNMEFNLYNEEEDRYGDIYQWWITDCTEDDKNYLEEHFGLLFSYSQLLDKYIRCVDHWGTSWDMVGCDTDIKNAERQID